MALTTSGITAPSKSVVGRVALPVIKKLVT
jgi:hypothetical protein